jgi:hypothetical protein
VLGCCYACAITCHAGHDVSFPKVRIASCACSGSGHCKHDLK